MKKYAHSRLPVYEGRRAAVFDAPVLRNASDVFEETTFNGTVEMTRVGTSRDFVRYGAAVFDAPVPRNVSNVFEETTFSGTAEKARVGIRDIRGTDYRVSIARDYQIHVEIIDDRFDTPVLRNGTVEMASTRSIIQSTGFFKTGHVSDRCQFRYTCSSQWQQPPSGNGFNQSLIQSTGFWKRQLNGI